MENEYVNTRLKRRKRVLLVLILLMVLAVSFFDKISYLIKLIF